MAETKTVKLEVKSNVDEVTAEFKKTGQEINKTTTDVNNLNKATIKGSEDIVKSQKKVQDSLKNTSRQAKKTESNFKKFDNAAQNIKGGFETAEGAMELLGQQSETTGAIISGVGEAMNVSKGIQSIKEYSKSVGLAGKVQKAFNLIVKANPLALLATAIVGIIGYFAIFTDAIDFAIQKLKDLGDWLGITNFEEEKLAEERKKRHEENMARHKAQESLLDAEIKQLEALGKSTIDLRRQRALAHKEALQQSLEMAGLMSKATNAINYMIKGQKTQGKLTARQIELQAELLNVDTELINLDKEQEAEEQKNHDAYIKRQNDKIKKQQDLEAIENKRLENLKKLENDLLDELAALEQANFNATLTDQELEEQKAREKYFRLKTLAENEIEDETAKNEALEIIEINHLNAMNDINVKYGEIDQANKDKQAADDKARDDKKKQDAIDAEEAKTEALAAIRQADISNIEAGINLVKSLGKDNKKVQAAAIIAENAVGVAKTIISTQAANAAALATPQAVATSGAAAVPVIARNNIAAGLSIATSVAATAQGLSALNESGSIEQGPELPEAQGGGGVISPEFNIVGDTNINDLENLGSQQPLQAYVTSQDVTTAQGLDRARVENATI
jgi:hypothetical protein